MHAYHNERLYKRSIQNSLNSARFVIKNFVNKLDSKMFKDIYRLHHRHSVQVCNHNFKRQKGDPVELKLVLACHKAPIASGLYRIE